MRFVTYSLIILAYIWLVDRGTVKELIYVMSLPTTRRATVEVFDSASTRDNCPVAPIVIKITPRDGPRRRHSLCCWRGVFTTPLPGNWRRTVASVGSLGNVFTESLLSNGSVRHSMLLWDARCSSFSVNNERNADVIWSYETGPRVLTLPN
jgi:hypothetical protein